MFNTIQLIGNQIRFIPRPLVANTSYMLANINNPFFVTLRRQAGANDYTNHVFPAHLGLAKSSLNVVGPIGLPNVTSFVPPPKGAFTF